MTLADWLAQATASLTSAGIGTARLDCLVLLEDILHKDRAHLLAHADIHLTAEQIKLLDHQISERAKHTPLAYIRGKSEFYGREFLLNHHVLEPRPETETMIDMAKSLPKASLAHILDIGTGSGAIAITMALELVTVQVTAIDIDPECIEVARRNCEEHKATVTLKQANLLSGAELGPGTTILANLPYVPDTYQINKAAQYEPTKAIFGGQDGLELYRQLFVQARNQTVRPDFILTESLPFQHKELNNIAEQAGFSLYAQEDFIQVFASS